MPHIYLIRHGQASFGARNYDVLSELGHRQASVLGASLAEQGLKFNRIVHGSLDRQRDTAANMAAEMPDSPALEIHPGFKEYDATGLFKAYMPVAMQENDELREAGVGVFKDQSLFQIAFERVTAGWLNDEPHALGDGKLERWADFVGRVRGALDEIASASERTDHIAIVTSGGPISVVCQLALGLTDQATINLNWSTYNSSVTDLRWSAERGVRLMGYNNISHLRLADDPELITLR